MFFPSEISSLYSNLIEEALASGETVSKEAIATYEQFKVLASGNVTPEQVNNILTTWTSELKEIENDIGKEAYAECKIITASMTHDIIPLVNKNTMTGGFFTSERILSLGGIDGAMAFLAIGGFKKLVTKDDFNCADNDARAFDAVLFGPEIPLSEKYAVAGAFMRMSKDSTEAEILKRLELKFHNWIHIGHPIETATRWETDVRIKNLEEALAECKPVNEMKNPNFDFFEFGSHVYLPPEYKSLASDRDYSVVAKTSKADFQSAISDMEDFMVKTTFPTTFGNLTVAEKKTEPGVKYEFVESDAKSAHHKAYKSLCLKRVLEDPHIAKVVVHTAKRLRSLGLKDAANAGISTWAIHNMTLGALFSLGYIEKKGDVTSKEQWLVAKKKLIRKSPTLVVNRVCAYLYGEIARGGVALGLAACIKFDVGTATTHALAAANSRLYVSDFYPESHKPNLTAKVDDISVVKLSRILLHASDCIGGCPVTATPSTKVINLITSVRAPIHNYTNIAATPIIKSGYLANGANYFIAAVSVGNVPKFYGVSINMKTAKKCAMYNAATESAADNIEYLVHACPAVAEMEGKSTILDYILTLRTDCHVVTTELGPTLISCPNTATISDEEASTIRPVTIEDIMSIIHQTVIGNGDLHSCTDARAGYAANSLTDSSSPSDSITSEALSLLEASMINGLVSTSTDAI
jgi:hypothetical protein